MNLLKTGLFSAVATAAKLVSAFAVMKIVAVIAGPQGVAQFGQFMSVASLMIVFAGGGIAAGMIKYIAEYQKDDRKVIGLIKSGLFYTLCSAVFICLVALYYSSEIAVLLMGGKEFQLLIMALALSQFFVALYNFIVAIINGMMDVKRLAGIHVVGALIGLAPVCLLSYYYNLSGALYGYLLGQGLMLVVAMVAFVRSPYFILAYFVPSFDSEHCKRLAIFSLMTLTSAFLAPLVQIVVRNILVDKFSWESVGYWQAVSKVSDAYLLFITMAISIYYLPKLSATVESKRIVDEIKRAYVFLMPVVLLMAAFVYLLRDKITALLFSNEFQGALYLYAPQLLGDVVKIASFILSYVMLAKAMTRTFLASEIAFSLMYVIWVFLLTDMFGLIGSMYAFILNYVLYFFFTLLVVSRFLRSA